MRILTTAILILLSPLVIGPSYAVEIPKPVVNVPKPTISQPRINVPRPNVTVSVPKVSTPRHVVTTPRPAVTTPKPVVNAPKVVVRRAPEASVPRVTASAHKVDAAKATALQKIESPKSAANVGSSKLNRGVRAPTQANVSSADGTVTEVRLPNGTFGKVVMNPDGTITLSNNLGTVTLTKQQMEKVAAGDMSALKALGASAQNGNATKSLTQQTNAEQQQGQSQQKSAGQGGNNGKEYYNPPANICPVQQCSSTVNEGTDGKGNTFYTVNFKWSGDQPPAAPQGMHYLKSNMTGCGGGTCSLFLQFDPQTASTPTSTPSSGGSLSAAMNAVANTLLPQAAAETPTTPRPGWRFVYQGQERVNLGNQFELRGFKEYVDERGQTQRIYDQAGPAAPGQDAPESPRNPSAAQNSQQQANAQSPAGEAGLKPLQTVTVGNYKLTIDPNTGMVSSPQINNGEPMSSDAFNKLVDSGALVKGTPPLGGDTGGGGKGAGGGAGSGDGNGRSGSGGTSTGASGGDAGIGTQVGDSAGSKAPQIPTGAACPQDGCQGTGGYRYSEPQGGFKTNFSNLSEYISYTNSLPTSDMQQSFKNNTTGILQQLINESTGPINPKSYDIFQGVHQQYQQQNQQGNLYHSPND